MMQRGGLGGVSEGNTGGGMFERSKRDTFFQEVMDEPLDLALVKSCREIVWNNKDVYARSAA